MVEERCDVCANSADIRGKKNRVEKEKYNNIEAFYAWLAGFWEGEGCFTVRTKQHHAIVRISQAGERGKAVATYIKDKLGYGKIYITANRYHRQPLFTWAISNRLEIIDFFKRIRPYIVFREEEVDSKLSILLSWEETGVHDWTKEEIEVLKNNWQLTDEELHKLLPRHTTVSIAYKRRKLGLYKKERQPISQRKWTKEEVEYLRKNFKYKRINELAKELGRSTHSVHNKTFRLGLRKKRKKGVLYGWE